MPSASTRSSVSAEAGPVRRDGRFSTCKRSCDHLPTGRLGRAAAAERAVAAGRPEPGVVPLGADDARPPRPAAGAPRSAAGEPSGPTAGPMSSAGNGTSSSDAWWKTLGSCRCRRTAGDRPARRRRAGRPARPPRRTPPAGRRAGRPRAGRAGRRRPRSAPIGTVLKSTIRIRPSGSRSTRSALPVSWMRSSPRSTSQQNATSVPSSSNSARASCQVTNRSRADSASTRSTADSQFASKSSWLQTDSRWSVSSPESAPGAGAVTRPARGPPSRSSPRCCATTPPAPCRARNHCRGQARTPASWLPDSRTGSPAGTTGRSAAVSGRMPPPVGRVGRPGPAAGRRSSTASASRASRMAACSRSAGRRLRIDADAAELADQGGQGQRPARPPGQPADRHPELGQEAGRLVALALGAGHRGDHQPAPGPGAGDVEQPALLGDPRARSGTGLGHVARRRAGPARAASRGGVRPASALLHAGDHDELPLQTLGPVGGEHPDRRPPEVGLAASCRPGSAGPRPRPGSRSPRAARRPPRDRAAMSNRAQTASRSRLARRPTSPPPGRVGRSRSGQSVPDQSSHSASSAVLPGRIARVAAAAAGRPAAGPPRPRVPVAAVVEQVRLPEGRGRSARPTAGAARCRPARPARPRAAPGPAAGPPCCPARPAGR